MTVVEHPNATIPDSVEVPRVGALQYELGFPTAGDVAEALRRDGLPARGAGLPVGLPRSVVRIDSGHGQAGPGHGLQRFRDRRQLRRPEVWLADRERHDDLRLRQHRSDRRAGRDRDPTRSHRRPAGRLLAALADRCRPARARRGEGWHVPARCRPTTTARFPRPATTSFTPRCTTTIFWSAGSSSTTTSADAVERIRKARVYPWSERDDPTPNKFVSISGALIDTTPPGGIEYWARLACGHRQQPRAGARPLLHGDAQAAGHREGQAVRARLHGRRPSSRRPPARRCDGTQRDVRELPAHQRPHAVPGHATGSV